MPIPLIYIAGLTVIGALGFGSYQATRDIGRGIRASMPVIAGSLLVYAAVKAARK